MKRFVLIFLIITSFFSVGYTTEPVRRMSKRPLFYRLPIGNPLGVQWFGRTQLSYELKANNDSNVYRYCQWAHCGLDLLASFGTPVYAGIYGKVVFVASKKNGIRAPYEGPYKIMVQVGDYVVCYGHTDGSAFVKEGDNVYPDTLLTRSGNESGYPNMNLVDHIHLEIRGPNGWVGRSQNPLYFMFSFLKNKLIEIATEQQIEVSMARFYDGKNLYVYTNNLRLNPVYLVRYPVPFDISLWSKK